MLFTLRISLPDRPGTLGLVASAFGRGGANIRTLDVVDSDEGVAVDDLLVEAPEGMQRAIALAMESVPGLMVEELRPLEAFRDLMSPLELAAVLAEADDDQGVLGLLVERIPEAVRSDWCIVVTAGPECLEVKGSGIGAPTLDGVRAPWLPLTGPVRLPPADWMPRSWTEGPAARNGLGKYELAAAPLLDGMSAALIGRRGGPQYRESELVELGQLARVASASRLLISS